MAYNLFLDDIRQPHEAGNYMYPVDIRKLYRLNDWIVVRSFDDFVIHIKKNGIPDCISFDHDLGKEHYSVGACDPIAWEEYHNDENREYTGYDCAKWLMQYSAENNIKLPTVILCHSMNPVGKENILKLFKQ